MNSSRRPKLSKAAAEQFLRIPARTDIPVFHAAEMDPGSEGADQADGGRPAGDGRASRRVDEVLGHEHQESRAQAVSAGALALEGSRDASASIRLLTMSRWRSQPASCSR